MKQKGSMSSEEEKIYTVCEWNKSKTISGNIN